MVAVFKFLTKRELLKIFFNQVQTNSSQLLEFTKKFFEQHEPTFINSERKVLKFNYKYIPNSLLLINLITKRKK